MLQALRQTLWAKRVSAEQPAGASRVHRGQADAASRVVVAVARVCAVLIAPGCGWVLNCHHRSAVRVARAPAIQRHPVNRAGDKHSRFKGGWCT